MNFIIKSKIKTIFVYIIIICLLLSIFMLIIPPKKATTVFNNRENSEAFILEKKMVTFDYLFKIDVNYLNRLSIPLNVTSNVLDKMIDIQLYDENNFHIKTTSEVLDDKIILKFNKIDNSKGQKFKLIITCDMNAMNFYKSSQNFENYISYNNEKIENALLIKQYGFETATYRIWYPILIATICFTMLGCEDKRGNKYVEK